MVDVSVVVPCFNAGQYITGAVASALSQDGVKVEVIVVDDCSTDDSRRVIADLAVAEPRVKYLFNEKNLGPSGSRNRAIAIAEGEWLAILDADDWYAPGRLQRLFSEAVSVGADAIADNIMIRDHEGNKPDYAAQPLFEGHKLIDQEGFFRAAIPEGNAHDVGFLKPIIRSDFLKSNSISYNESFRVGEDFLLYADIVSAGAKFYYVNEAGYIYRQTPTSITANAADNTPALRQGVSELLNLKKSSLSPQIISLLERRSRLLQRRQNWREMRSHRRASVLSFLTAAITSPRKALDFVIESKG